VAKRGKREEKNLSSPRRREGLFHQSLKKKVYCSPKGGAMFSRKARKKKRKGEPVCPEGKGGGGCLRAAIQGPPCKVGDFAT